MRIHNIYVDDAGETHWRDIEVQWVEERNGSKLSARLPANGIIFRETGGDYDLSWHPAPRRQYIINLDGGVKITASDGEAREIGAGEVILVEDIRGKGHLSKSIGRQGAAFDLRAGGVATRPASRPVPGAMVPKPARSRRSPPLPPIAQPHIQLRGIPRSGSR